MWAAPPHAQSEEQPPSASRLPAGQDPISGILLPDSGWVSNLGSLGEGLPYRENRALWDSRAPPPSPRLPPGRAPEGGHRVERRAPGTNTVDSITCWPRCHTAPSACGSRAAVSRFAHHSAALPTAALLPLHPLPSKVSSASYHRQPKSALF